MYGLESNTILGADNWITQVISKFVSSLERPPEVSTDTGWLGWVTLAH